MQGGVEGFGTNSTGTTEALDNLSGGGASLNGFNSGTGGAGADGIVVVISYP